MKIWLFLSAALISNVANAQSSLVLVDNEDFYITYKILENSTVVIEVEDLKDNSHEGTNPFPVPEHVDIYDYCKIEVDRNNDKKFSNADKDFLRSLGIGNGGIFCRQYKNSGSGVISTDKMLKQHILYRFKIPIQEMVANNVDTARFRVKIRRQNSLEKSDNTMFIFPLQSAEEFIAYKIPLPENLIKRVGNPKTLKSDVYTKQPDFFGIYLFDNQKYYGLIPSKITKGVLATYEDVTSGEIKTWGSMESGRHIDYIDKQNGFTRVKNENRSDYMIHKNIDGKLISIKSKVSKVLAVGDAGSVTNLRIYSIIPRETSEGVIIANGQPEGTVVYIFNKQYTSNASKTLSNTSILYNYTEFEKGMYALVYKGEAYLFQIE